MNDMFCFQCQQTAHNRACENKVGVCGKKADTANLQDELVGALIGVARAAENGSPTRQTDILMMKGLFTTLTNVNFDDSSIKKLKTEAEKEKGRINAEKLPAFLSKNVIDTLVEKFNIIPVGTHPKDDLREALG